VLTSTSCAQVHRRGKASSDADCGGLGAVLGRRRALRISYCRGIRIARRQQGRQEQQARRSKYQKKEAPGAQTRSLCIVPRKALLTPPEPFDPRTSRFTRCRTRRSFTTGTDHPKAARPPRRRARRPFVAPNRSARRLPDSHGAGPEDPLPCSVDPPEDFPTPTAPGPKAHYRAGPLHPKASRSPRRRIRRSFAAPGRSARRLPNPHGAGPEGPLPCRISRPEGFPIHTTPDPKILCRAGPFRPKASRPPRRRARRPFTVPDQSTRRLSDPHDAGSENPSPCDDKCPISGRGRQAEKGAESQFLVDIKSQFLWITL
jgi:hypothetical protein